MAGLTVALTAARMAARMAGLTVAPMAVRTAAPTGAPMAVRTVRPDRGPDHAGPGGAGAPPGPAAVHQPRPAGLRRSVLGPPSAAQPCRGDRRLVHRPARPARGRRTALRRGLRTPFLRIAKDGAVVDP